MKVLQINCVYKNGSTGKITYDIHKELQERNIESVVCYGRGERVCDKSVYKICSELYAKANNLRSRCTGLMYGGCLYSTRKLISIIKKEKPDIVHLQCINGYFVNIYRLVTWLKKNNIKTVLTLHAEFMHTANCGYALECDKWKSGCGDCPRLKKETKSLGNDGTHCSWMKMKDAFNEFENNLIVVSVSPWLMERAKQSPILESKNHQIVMNGIDTEQIFYIRDVEELRKKHNITDEKIIFHVSPMFSKNPSHIKGGYYILQLAEKLKEENIKIFVAGSYDQTIKAPDNVIFLGKVQNQELLAQYYSLADVTVLTSKKETFSMIVAESLCCGTPVVGFKAGAPEQIAISEYSEFVEYGDIEKLKEKVVEVLNRTCVKQEISKKAECYSRKVMTENYLAVYRKLIGEKEC